MKDGDGVAQASTAAELHSAIADTNATTIILDAEVIRFDTAPQTTSEGLLSALIIARDLSIVDL